MRGRQPRRATTRTAKRDVFPLRHFRCIRERLNGRFVNSNSTPLPATPSPSPLFLLLLLYCRRCRCFFFCYSYSFPPLALPAHRSQRHSTQAHTYLPRRARSGSAEQCGSDIRGESERTRARTRVRASQQQRANEPQLFSARSGASDAARVGSCIDRPRRT